MLYSFTAKDKHGGEYTEELQAKSKFDVYERVRASGGKILSVREIQVGGVMNTLNKWFSTVNLRDKILLAKNLSSMLTAGLSVTRALDVMEKQARKTALKDLLHSLTIDVSKGEALSIALKRREKIFPQVFVSMVKAGEESGNLAGALHLVAIQMEKSYDLSRRVRGALIYPGVIISLMVVIAILLLTYMVPTLTATFEGLNIELPLSTRVIIYTSNFLVDHTMLVFLTLIAFVVSVISFFKSRVGKRLTDSLFLRLPMIGFMIREINSARTARTLSSLLASGVPIVNAIEVTEEVLPNHLYKKAMSEAREAIQKGETLSRVLARYEFIYPPFVSEMASVGEETGKMAELLLNVATFYEEDVDQKTKELSTIIEPALMIIIGAGVGIFAISILAPTYSLADNI